MRGWAAQEAGVQLGIGCCHDRGLELAKEYCKSLSLKTWTLKAFALNAEHTAAQVRARLLDLLILAMMGFVVMGCGRYALVGYAEDDEDFVICCNRPEQRKCT